MPTPSAQSYPNNELDAQQKIKICAKCGFPKPYSEFHKRTMSKDGRCPRCKTCSSEDHRKTYIKNPKSRIEYSRNYRHDVSTWATRIIRGCRRRARKKGVPFNLIVADILPLPKICPVLKVELDYCAGPTREIWASVDRIKPKYGYVSGNVRIISFAANFAKGAGIGDLVIVRRRANKELLSEQPSLFDGIEDVDKSCPSNSLIESCLPLRE
jgi:hypothetical protein